MNVLWISSHAKQNQQKTYERAKALSYFLTGGGAQRKMNEIILKIGKVKPINN